MKMSGRTLVFLADSSNIPQPVRRRKSRGDVYADSAEKQKKERLQNKKFSTLFTLTPA